MQRHDRIARPIVYGNCQSVREPMNVTGRGNVLRVILHDDSHTVHTQSIRLGHHTLSEPIGNVIGTEEGGDHDSNVQRNETENDGIPSPENHALISHIRKFASGENAPCITGLGNGSLNEGAEVPATLKLILDPQSSFSTE